MASNDTLHLHHQQLFVVISVGQYALHKLLAHFALLAEPAETDGGIALSKIFTRQKDKVKNFSNITNNPGVIKLVYQDKRNDLFQPSIEISSLDINLLIEILREIEDFPTCDTKFLARWSCKNSANHLNKCCSDCDHKCPNCGKEKCKKGCCVNDDGICGKHKCKHCIENNFECKSNKNICCKNCKLCLHCLMRGARLSSWQSLLEKLVNGSIKNICQMQILRLALSIISIFRNITMHLTPLECEKMDRGTFNDPKAPIYCISWLAIRDTIWFSVKFLLNYLSTASILTSLEREAKLETLDLVCTAATINSLLIYDNRIQNIMQLESFSNTENKLTQIFQKIEATQALLCNGNLKVDVHFQFKKKIRFHLECPEADNIERVFKNLLKRYFSKFRTITEETFEVSMLRFNKLKQKSTKTKNVPLKIEITSSEIDFKKFKNRKSEESKALWRELKECVKKELPIAEVELWGWEQGSLLIFLSLWRTDENLWSEKDIPTIDSFLLNLPSMVEDFLPLCECQCKRIGDGVEMNEKNELSSMAGIAVQFSITTTVEDTFYEDFEPATFNEMVLVELGYSTPEECEESLQFNKSTEDWIWVENPQDNVMEFSRGEMHSQSVHTDTTDYPYSTDYRDSTYSGYDTDSEVLSPTVTPPTSLGRGFKGQVRSPILSPEQLKKDISDVTRSKVYDANSDSDVFFSTWKKGRQRTGKCLTDTTDYPNTTDSGSNSDSQIWFQTVPLSSSSPKKTKRRVAKYHTGSTGDSTNSGSDTDSELLFSAVQQLPAPSLNPRPVPLLNPRPVIKKYHVRRISKHAAIQTRKARSPRKKPNREQHYKLAEKFKRLSPYVFLSIFIFLMLFHRLGFCE